MRMFRGAGARDIACTVMAPPPAVGTGVANELSGQ